MQDAAEIAAVAIGRLEGRLCRDGHHLFSWQLGAMLWA